MRQRRGLQLKENRPPGGSSYDWTSITKQISLSHPPTCTATSTTFHFSNLHLENNCASVEDPRITPLQVIKHSYATIINNHAFNFENSSSGGRVACGVLSILAQRSLVQFSSLRSGGNCPTPCLAAGNGLEIAFKDFERIFSLHRLLTNLCIAHCVDVGPLQSLRLGLVCIGFGRIPKISAGFSPVVVVVVSFSIYDPH